MIEKPLFYGSRNPVSSSLAFVALRCSIAHPSERKSVLDTSAAFLRIITCSVDTNSSPIEAVDDDKEVIYIFNFSCFCM